jgi:uncharacterized protein YlxW (UPF0749 family)
MSKHSARDPEERPNVDGHGADDDTPVAEGGTSAANEARTADDRTAGDDPAAGAGNDDDGQTDADDEHADEDRVAASRGRRLSTRGKLAIAAVCLLLGIGVAVQVRLTSDTERDLRGARQEDLVRILDDLDNQYARLGNEVDDLADAQEDLASGGGAAEAAQQEAQARLDQLAILNGTVAATGPGIVLTISDAPDDVPPEMMVSVIQELRAAGAEAIQVGSTRVAMSSAVTGEDGKIMIDGQPVTFPLSVLAIGDPETLATAMGIPGGAVASVTFAGAKASVVQSNAVQITALRELDTPDYAEPAKPTK